MLMTDVEIKAAMETGELLIENFDPASLQGTSYDARVGDRAIVGGRDKEINLADEQSLTIRPGEFLLVVTREKFKVTRIIAGHLGMKTYYTRKGFVVLAGLQIDPGFEGHLVIGGYNASPRSLILDYEAPFLTVEFHRLSRPVERLFVSGDEQRAGQIPRVDKDYLRTLEMLSLHEVTGKLSSLAESAGELAKSVREMQNQLKYFYAPLMMGTLLTVIGFGLAALLK